MAKNETAFGIRLNDESITALARSTAAMERFADSVDKLCVAVEKLTVSSEEAKSPKKKKDAVSIVELRDAYERLYEARWKQKPARNATTNGMLATIARRIPAEHHAALGEFFIRQNDAFYLRDMHHLRWLVRDCETLLTRMQTGVVITKSKADEISRTSANAQASANYLRQKHGKDTP